MIHRLGIDSVCIERMQTNIERYGDRFAKKILRVVEWGEYKESNRPADFLAKHFAAREAMVKAPGTGFRKGLSLKYFSVSYDEFGRPEIQCNEFANKLPSLKKIQFSRLSVSDENDYAFACVVLKK